MISVYQAEHIILNSAKLLNYETIELSKAYGRVLRENISNDRDQPCFDKALVDGIAIHTSCYDKGARHFPIEKVIAAGQKPYTLKNPNHCVQIMTGAVLPNGCNAVIPIEQVELEPDRANLKDWTLVKIKQNIRFKGADAKKGQTLIKESCQLFTPHLATLAAVGKLKLKVSVQPKAAIISTGDELVDIHKQPQSYQARRSNSYALKFLLEGSQLAKASLFHYPDQKEKLLKGIQQNLKDFDMLILSGGVSMGEFDYIPEVLNRLGVKTLFHKIAQKPGKPFWFGKTNNGKVVFALPGNPISTQICTYRYVLPFLKKAAGLKLQQETALLQQGPQKPGDLTLFIPVKTSQKNGIRYAEMVPTGGSGDFASLAQADGFIEYDQNQKTIWPYFSWRV